MEKGLTKDIDLLSRILIILENKFLYSMKMCILKLFQCIIEADMLYYVQVEFLVSLLENGILDSFWIVLHSSSWNLQETMMPCAEAVENNNLTDLLVQVMMAGQDYLSAVKTASTPKYVLIYWANSLLFILVLGLFIVCYSLS